MPGRGKDSYSIQSVENALDLLEALCEEDEVRISELSEKLEMNKTSVFRLLATFESRGYVVREEGSGKYRLGLSAYEVGQRMLSRMGLLRKARPSMEKLVRQCNEAVYLVVRRDGDILFLDMVDTAHQVKIVSLVGRHLPLASCVPGKVLLAFFAPDEGGPPDPPSADMVPEEEMEAIRQQGYCIDLQGAGEGVACVAVPLFNGSGEAVGALSLVGPDFRLSREKIETDILPHLREAGEIISSKLGYLGHYLKKEEA